MFFFFRKKQIVLDLITSSQSAYDCARIQPAENFFPEWWKQLPPRYALEEGLIQSPTARTCPGIIDFYKTGFIIPMWSDLNIELSAAPNHFRYQYSDRTSVVSTHDIEQHGDAFDSNITQHVKLAAPWLGVSKIPFKTLWSNPFYNNNQFFDSNTLPGVVEFNRTSMQFNINIILKKEPGKVRMYEFKYGDPVVHMAPLTDEKIKLKHHLVTPEEYNRVNKQYAPFKFANTFRTMRKLQDSQPQSKCPFRF